MTRPASWRRSGRKIAPRQTLLALLLIGLVACSGVNPRQLRLCESLVPALEGTHVRFEILHSGPIPETEDAVRVRYRLLDPADDAPHWIECQFTGGGLGAEPLTLAGVISEREGALSDVRLYLLRHYWLGRYEGQVRGSIDQPAATSSLRDLLYFLQIGANAVTLGALYGLLAIGYSLVFAIIGRINLAFGEIAMVGAYTTFVAVTIMALLGMTTLPLALLLVLALVALIGAAYGFATERLVFRPLRAVPSQAPLIATVGLAIFLQEYLRLAQGSDDRRMQPVFTDVLNLAEVPGFVLVISVTQIAVLITSALLFAGLWFALTRSSFGRAVKACTDDVEMAAFCGVNVHRTIAAVFSLAAAYAAIAGMVILLRYGGVGFYDGFFLGFKALTAAILGGIGSIPGAMLGGLLIGALETFWAGYLNLAYKDVAVFGLLATVLIWRPHGLFGQPVRLANDAFRTRPGPR